MSKLSVAPVRLLLILALVGGVAQLATAAAPARASGPEAEDGYITVDDGTRLRFRYWFPDLRPAAQLHDAEAEAKRRGRGWPVILNYTPYGSAIQRSTTPYTKRGFAVVLVSVRGTGCSEGEYDAWSDRERRDAHQVIDWIAAQPWADGVGITGWSGPGLAGLMGARGAPKALKAVAVSHVVADPFRDTVRVGGLFNAGMGAAYAGLVAGMGGAPHADVALDSECRENIAASPGRHFQAERWAQEEFVSDWTRERAALDSPHRITAPTLLIGSWQDESIGSGAIDLLPQLRGSYHAIFTNGDHDMAPEPQVPDREGVGTVLEEQLDFFEHHLAGVDNGYDDKPRVRLWWDTRSTASGLAPGWETRHSSWPPRSTSVRRLFLRGGGRLADDAPTGPEAPDLYAHVPGSGQGAVSELWDAGPAAGAFRAYTYDVREDLVVAGAASVDLWLETAAPTGDLQVVLSEVRPDANGSPEEVYVGQGYLRTSHRSLDATRSTATSPFHTHERRDAREMPAGVPEQVRIRVEPFAHAFRAGSKLRLYVEAARSRPDPYWGFAPHGGAAPHRIHHDPVRVSSIALAQLPQARPEGTTVCDALTRRLCRPDVLAATP